MIAREAEPRDIKDFMVNLAGFGFDDLVRNLQENDCAHLFSSPQFQSDWEVAIQHRFDEAISNGHVAVAERLLKYGADTRGLSN